MGNENTNNTIGGESLELEGEASLLGLLRRKRNLVTVILAVLGLAILAAIVALGTREAVTNANIKTLEQYISRFEDLEDKLKAEDADAAPSVDALLADLTALGKKSGGYAGAKAWALAADIHIARKEWAQAEEAYLESARRGGKNIYLTPVSLFNAAVAAENAGNTDAALEHYSACLDYADFAAAARAQFAVARLYEARSDTEAALAAYRNVIEKWPSESAWANLAQSRVITLEMGQ